MPTSDANTASASKPALNDLGEFETAETSLVKALEVYRRLGDPHLQGHTLVNPERGLAHIRKALVLIDPAREARLLLCAEYDLAWYLTTSAAGGRLGRPEPSPPPLPTVPDRRTQLHFHWLEGRIAFRPGDYTEAQTIFAQIWDAFRPHDLQHDLVLLSIDLAEVLVAKGAHPGRGADRAAPAHPGLLGSTAAPFGTRFSPPPGSKNIGKL